jgi:hypothetical protein
VEGDSDALHYLVMTTKKRLQWQRPQRHVHNDGDCNNSYRHTHWRAGSLPLTSFPPLSPPLSLGIRSTTGYLYTLQAGWDHRRIYCRKWLWYVSGPRRFTRSFGDPTHVGTGRLRDFDLMTLSHMHRSLSDHIHEGCIVILL